MRPELNPWPAGFGSGAEEREALLVLSHVRTATPRDLLHLARQEGSARACLAAALAGACGQGDREVLAAVGSDAARHALGRVGARMLAPADAAYPRRLFQLTDPPAAIFVRGEPPGGPGVAIVGARACSSYGREVARSLGAGLAAAGLTVVSGAARGIDAAAHRGALDVTGSTVAVLGSGIDVAYPASNRRLIEQIADEGAVLSEYPPGTPAERRHFPARNRIVVALALGVVVVEGAPGSGSMISVEHASDLGRDVLAVPGPVTSPVSAVPHELLREGAALVRHPVDVLDALHLLSAPPRAGEDPAAGLAGNEARIYEALRGEAVTLDALVGASGLPPGDALTALTALEIRGLVRVSGGRFQRAAAPAPGRPEPSGAAPEAVAPRR